MGVLLLILVLLLLRWLALVWLQRRRSQRLQQARQSVDSVRQEAVTWSTGCELAR